MSKGPEAVFSRWFLERLPKGCTAQRIETVTGRGVPDIALCIRGLGTVWIEMKSGGKAPLLRSEQFAWMQRWNTCGALCFVLWRSSGNPWHIWNINETTKISPKGTGLEIVSPSLMDGYTTDLIIKTICKVYEERYHGQKHDTGTGGSGPGAAAVAGSGLP